MFSITTIASSTTKPVAMVSAISDRLSRLKPNWYMIASAPISDSGTDRLGMIVAGMLRRNRKMTITTRPTASASSNSTSSTEARIVIVRSVSGFTVIAAGSEATERRQQRLDAVDDLDDVCAGLALNIDDERRRRVHPRPEAAVLGRDLDGRDVGKQDRRVVAVGDDRLRVIVRIADLIVGVDRRGLRRPVEISLGRVDVEVGDRRAQVVEIDADGGKGERIDVDANGGALPAGDRNQSDAGQACDNFGTRRVSMMSSTSVSFIESEATPSVRIGASAGLTLA